MMDILQLIFGKLKAIHTAITGGVRTTDSRQVTGRVTPEMLIQIGIEK